MNNNILAELLEQVKDIDQQIANLENFREEIYNRIDVEVEKEGGI